jgi:hypothetical protein
MRLRWRPVAWTAPDFSHFWNVTKTFSSIVHDSEAVVRNRFQGWPGLLSKMIYFRVYRGNCDKDFMKILLTRVPRGIHNYGR